MHFITRIYQIVSSPADPDNVRMAAESVPLNGIEMYYETEGAGEPLLLLHGGTGCQENWIHAGGDQFAREYTLIKPDARGHGRTTNPGKTITHRQCALDTLALLDHLGIRKCRAIGLSMGGNILLHMATLQPDRIEAMVIVSATMHFPEQARAIMTRVPSAADQPPQEWEIMRRRHKHGDEQIVALWDWAHGMSDSYDDMNFTPASLSKITASTLIVYGDRDPLYPVEMALRCIALSLGPPSGSCPTLDMGLSFLTLRPSSPKMRSPSCASGPAALTICRSHIPPCETSIEISNGSKRCHF